MSFLPDLLSRFPSCHCLCSTIPCPSHVVIYCRCWQYVVVHSYYITNPYQSSFRILSTSVYLCPNFLRITSLRNPVSSGPPRFSFLYPANFRPSNPHFLLLLATTFRSIRQYRSNKWPVQFYFPSSWYAARLSHLIQSAKHRWYHAGQSYTSFVHVLHWPPSVINPPINNAMIER